MESMYLNALNLAFGLARIKKLIAIFKSAEAAWRASDSKILKFKFEDGAVKECLKKRAAIDPAKEWQKLEKLNIQTVSFFEKSYPQLLKEISSPPVLLYLKGNAELLAEKSLGVVGTRTPTSYGRAAVEMLVPKLAEAGLTIVSGLAQGIDAVAHAAALKCGAKTVGILGCGLDQVYPLMNEPLARQMLAQNNLIVSEYPVETPAFKQNFPARNRIIAGLSLGTLVIESKVGGGALITAQQALEANREVFALPGPVTQPTSAGTNNLIREGAKIVLSAEDILQELNLKTTTAQEKLELNLDKLTAEEKIVAGLVRAEPVHIDKIIQITKLKPHVVGAVLTGLELKGYVKNTGGQIYTLG